MSLDPTLVLEFPDLKAFDQWDCGLRIALSLVNPSALGPCAAAGPPHAAALQHGLVRAALGMQAAEGAVLTGGGGGWRRALLRGGRRASVDDPTGERLRRAQEWAMRSAEVVARHAAPASAAGAPPGTAPAPGLGAGLFPLPHQLSLPSVHLAPIRPRPLQSQAGYSIGSYPPRVWRGTRGVTASSDGDALGASSRGGPGPGAARRRGSLRRASSDSGSSGSEGGARRREPGPPALDVASIRAALAKPLAMQVPVHAGPVPAHAQRGAPHDEAAASPQAQAQALPSPPPRWRAASSGDGSGASLSQPPSRRAAPPPAVEFLNSLGRELKARAAAAAASSAGGRSSCAASGEAGAEAAGTDEGGAPRLRRKRSCSALSSKAAVLACDGLEGSPRAPAGLEGMGSLDGLIGGGSSSSGGLLKARFPRASGEASSAGDASPPPARGGRRGGAVTSSPRFGGAATEAATAQLWDEVGSHEHLAAAAAAAAADPPLLRLHSAPEALAAIEAALAGGAAGGAPAHGSESGGAAAGAPGELKQDSVASSATAGSFVFSLSAAQAGVLAGLPALLGPSRAALGAAAAVEAASAPAPAAFSIFGAQPGAPQQQGGGIAGADALRRVAFAQAPAACDSDGGAAGGCSDSQGGDSAGSPTGLRSRGSLAAGSLTLGSFSVGSFTAATLYDGFSSREASFSTPAGASPDANPASSPGRGGGGGACSPRASPLGAGAGPDAQAQAQLQAPGRALGRGPSGVRRASTSFRQGRASGAGTIVSEAWTRALSMSWGTGGDADELQSAAFAGWSSAFAGAADGPAVRPPLCGSASQPDLSGRAAVGVGGGGAARGGDPQDVPQEAEAREAPAVEHPPLLRSSSGGAALPPLPAASVPDGRSRSLSQLAQGAALPALLEGEGGDEGDDSGGHAGAPTAQSDPLQAQLQQLPPLAARGGGGSGGGRPSGAGKLGSGGGKAGSGGGLGPARSSGGGGGQRPLSMGGAYREALAAGAAAAARLGPLTPFGLSTLTIQRGDSSQQAPGAGCCAAAAVPGCVCGAGGGGGSLSPRHLQLRLPKHRRASSAHSMMWDGSGQWSAGADHGATWRSVLSQAGAQPPKQTPGSANPPLSGSPPPPPAGPIGVAGYEDLYSPSAATTPGSLASFFAGGDGSPTARGGRGGLFAPPSPTFSAASERLSSFGYPMRRVFAPSVSAPARMGDILLGAGAR
jgi:hypothetical protein